MSEQANCETTRNATSSPAAADGRSPSDSPDGPTTGESGRAPAHASRSASPGCGGVQRTLATCGLHGSRSSRSARLQLLLESRLRAATGLHGSIEYTLTWRPASTPSGRLCCLLRASARRTSDIGCSGWPTPNCNERGPESRESTDRRGSGGIDLQSVAQLAGWNTPRATDGTKGGPGQTGGSLPADAAQSGWPTPTTRDGKDGACGDANVPENALLGRCCHGAITNGVGLPTRKSGVLNPELSRWLMGYPRAWARAIPGWQAWTSAQHAITESLRCGCGATRSSPRSPRSSCERT